MKSVMLTLNEAELSVSLSSLTASLTSIFTVTQLIKPPRASSDSSHRVSVSLAG